jgi:hypothetical protein
MANDVNKTFVSFSAACLIGGLVAAVYSGVWAIFGALFICYAMLVATNAISRGEKKARKQ